MRFLPYTFFILSGAAAGVGMLCAILAFFYADSSYIDGTVNLAMIYGAISIFCFFSAPLWFAVGRMLHTLDMIRRNTDQSAGTL
ncbi:hypothetical protein V6617_02365 [Pelagibacterium nitratireducens]|uniref:Uncharacterized protein n=1 Tax=Pelagibacterium nitratireducens TaxID=1046114 RepID=A0ABZ2I1W4_9HYPH